MVRRMEQGFGAHTPCCNPTPRNYYLILGPLFQECPPLGPYPTQKHLLNNLKQINKGPKKKGKKYPRKWKSFEFSILA